MQECVRPRFFRSISVSVNSVRCHFTAYFEMSSNKQIGPHSREILLLLYGQETKGKKRAHANVGRELTCPVVSVYSGAQSKNPRHTSSPPPVPPAACLLLLSLSTVSLEDGSSCRQYGQVLLSFSHLSKHAFAIGGGGGHIGGGLGMIFSMWGGVGGELSAENLRGP